MHTLHLGYVYDRAMKVNGLVYYLRQTCISIEMALIMDRQDIDGIISNIRRSWGFISALYFHIVLH